MDDYPYWSKELIEQSGEMSKCFDLLLIRKLRRAKIPKDGPQLVYKGRNGKERKVYGEYIVLNRENTCLDIEFALNDLKDMAERVLKEEGLEKHLQDVQYIIKAQNFDDGNPPFPIGYVSEPGKITVAWKLVVEEDN